MKATNLTLRPSNIAGLVLAGSLVFGGSRALITSQVSRNPSANAISPAKVKPMHEPGPNIPKAIPKPVPSEAQKMQKFYFSDTINATMIVDNSTDYPRLFETLQALGWTATEVERIYSAIVAKWETRIAEINKANKTSIQFRIGLTANKNEAFAATAPVLFNGKPMFISMYNLTVVGANSSNAVEAWKRQYGMTTDHELRHCEFIVPFFAGNSFKLSGKQIGTEVVNLADSANLWIYTKHGSPALPPFSPDEIGHRISEVYVSLTGSNQELANTAAIMGNVGMRRAGKAPRRDSLFRNLGIIPIEIGNAVIANHLLCAVGTNQLDQQTRVGLSTLHDVTMDGLRARLPEFRQSIDGLYAVLNRIADKSLDSRKK